MNFSGALSYLVATLVNLYITMVMLRLLLQWVRADFYNPICQFLVRLTSPLLVLLRRAIPAIGRLDTASLVLMLLLEFCSVGIVSWLQSYTLSFPGLLLLTVVKLLLTLLWLLFFLILVAIILSWLGSRARHPAVPLVYQLTEPVLAPFRRLVPPIAGIDLAPLLALIAIRFLILLLGW